MDTTGEYSEWASGFSTIDPLLFPEINKAAAITSNRKVIFFTGINCLFF